MKAGAVALIATFLIGLVVGIQSGGEPEVRYKVIHDTETVTETVTVEVPSDPPSECADMADLAKRILKAGGTLDSASAGMLDIMSRLRIAVATNDGNEANVIETDLRQLDGRTIAAVEELGLTRDPLQVAINACLKGIQ